jgi:hypothetical protein
MLRHLVGEEDAKNLADSGEELDRRYNGLVRKAEEVHKVKKITR